MTMHVEVHAHACCSELSIHELFATVAFFSYSSAINWASVSYSKGIHSLFITDSLAIQRLLISYCLAICYIATHQAFMNFLLL